MREHRRLSGVPFGAELLNGEVIALLVTAPSKTDRDRVIPMSVDLFHVIAMIVLRRTSHGPIQTDPTTVVRRQNSVMAWEWVAPAATGLAAVTGVFFTWLTGRQGRSQVERMARRTEEAAARDRLTQERREAYFTAMLTAELTLRRKRYEREGKADKLAELDQTWPKGKRVQMEMDAVVGLETYGSPQARELLERWSEAASDEDETQMRAVRDAMIDRARHELGTHLLKPSAGSEL